LYVLLLVAGFGLTFALLQREPQTDVDHLAQQVLDSPEPLAFYRYGGASLGLYGRRGYSLSLYVGDTSRFSCRFLVLTRFDGQLHGELMRTQGREGVSMLDGARLEAYLRRCQLDLSAIDRAHTAWVNQGARGAR